MGGRVKPPPQAVMYESPIPSRSRPTIRKKFRRGDLLVPSHPKSARSGTPKNEAAESPLDLATLAEPPLNVMLTLAGVAAFVMDTLPDTEQVILPEVGGSVL